MHIPGTEMYFCTYLLAVVMLLVCSPLILERLLYIKSHLPVLHALLYFACLYWAIYRSRRRVHLGYAVKRLCFVEHLGLDVLRVDMDRKEIIHFKRTDFNKQSKFGMNIG